MRRPKIPSHIFGINFVPHPLERPVPQHAVEGIPAHYLGFVAESSENLVIQMIQRHLDNDFVVVFCINRFPNRTHSALANANKGFIPKQSIEKLVE